MAGLLAWAADVVGHEEEERSDGEDSIPLILTPDQQQYLTQLNLKAASLTRSIQDLRLRIPPSDISLRLPHLHAHSLSSNAALALQLNSHSDTRQQAQNREAKLLEENSALENEVSNCHTKIQEKLEEIEELRKKLEEMDLIEESLKAELQNMHKASSIRQSDESSAESDQKMENEDKGDTSNSALMEKLENKKKELQMTEDRIQTLEKKWAELQEKALKSPSPAQREKALDKQLHSLIQQLAAKQAQAEALVNEIHLKEKELERLNGMWRRVENGNREANAARNRFARGGSSSAYDFDDTDLYGHNKLPYHTGGRAEQRQRLRLIRSSFVLYIFLLHVIVFIKISFF
ncbi:uncharacterized protein LOC141643131 [Silene latifolia]|uniref:uncharacterized protein LOC141643131 n=1 Tax=Silene latifolia TaxID=37657 RepID=UPI003D7766E1